MPFLHGFRRVLYEYQPLVDAVLCVVGLLPEEWPKSLSCGSLEEVLKEWSDSPFFEEGISYSLFKVSEEGQVHAAEILLGHGADPNFEDPVSYYSPLHIAVLKNKPSVVRLLIRHGADIERRDRIHESSPLDLASEELERLPCMHMLLDMGAEVNAKDRNLKTALLHALASSDGLTVHSTENIQLLLQRGADVHVSTLDGETVMSWMVFLVKGALESNVEDAAEIGRFCLRATRLLLAHGADPSLCPGDGKDGEPSLTQTSLEYFDLLFPLAVLLLQSGVSFLCPHHSAPCWSGYRLVFQRLQRALQQCSNTEQASELMEKAETLLDLARVSAPSLPPPPDMELPEPGQDPHVQALLGLYERVVEQEASPPPLRSLCRALIRGRLQPWPLDERVTALPLPNKLKDFLLPENTLYPKPGWDCFSPLSR